MDLNKLTLLSRIQIVLDHYLEINSKSGIFIGLFFTKYLNQLNTNGKWVLSIKYRNLSRQYLNELSFLRTNKS